MRDTRYSVPRYDTEKILVDLALKGWMATDLARACQKSDATISHFLTGARQTPKTAAAIAKALGFSIRRYLRREAA